MPYIKNIKIGDTVYDIKALSDINGNDISTTYATKQELNDKVDKDGNKVLSEKNFTSTYETKLKGIADNANNYVHPTSSGNKHIPSGGSSGQILIWSSDGTAQWGSNFTSATDQTLGLVKQGTAVEDVSIELATAETVAQQLNTLLASLRTAGIIKSS